MEKYKEDVYRFSNNYGLVVRDFGEYFKAYPVCFPTEAKEYFFDNTYERWNGMPLLKQQVELMKKEIENWPIYSQEQIQKDMEEKGFYCIKRK